MPTYQIDNKIVDPSTQDGQAALAAAHTKRLRPQCLCQAEGVPMYIARAGDRYLVKRMPDCGAIHHQDCASYEPPAELSGAGEVLGTAIVEDESSGQVKLATAFSLRTTPGRAPPTASESASGGDAQDSPRRLTLLATLHYLYDQGELTRWAPGMTGKRNWGVVRHQIMAAAGGKALKGLPLHQILFVPEMYNAERADQIIARRSADIADATQGEQNRLFLIVCELKDLLPSRYGFRAAIKHMPDMSLMLSPELHTQIRKRFGAELELRETDENGHTLLMGTVSVTRTGTPHLREAALLSVSERWLPYANRYELAVQQQLVEARRRFVLGQRYNLRPDVPIAYGVLTDSPSSTALYVTPPGASVAYRDRLLELIETSAMPHWHWDVESGLLPPLPPPRAST
ncbi:DUF1173 domain-containing protein [Achromobacter sp. GG226]|uniref:DUF1173 family protein n=1 Tax=Verticiella alkaliphila TaxID=2779529 RepID=UPI001C0BBFDC|nr:DUF1173 family protein [Verticiella sp. GG226]MBU4610303.1 DUF1173 domain-containing protein [Verticiella sp. GG226]